jgi:alanine dehydrogenase
VKRKTAMRIGTVREIKNHEYRVGLAPESVEELVSARARSLGRNRRGLGIGAADSAYEAAGAAIKPDARTVFDGAEMIVKVKEPQAVERAMLRRGQSCSPTCTSRPIRTRRRISSSRAVTAIAYETVTGPGGGLPLLKPMSQVAGRMAIQAGATALEKAHGGRGVLLGGVPGVLPRQGRVIGGGVVGFNAAQMAVGLGADVTILDRDATAC